MANSLFKALPKLANPNAAVPSIKLKGLKSPKIPQMKFPKLAGLKSPTSVSSFKLPGVKSMGLGKIATPKNTMLQSVLGQITRNKVRTPRVGRIPMGSIVRPPSIAGGIK